MVKSNSPVLKCFWLPPTHYNTCISGANQSTISKYGNGKSGDYYSHDYFEKVTLPLLRENSKPYPADQKYLKKSNAYCNGFREIVNDALRDIYNGRNGFVFTTEQLSEIINFVPDVNVMLNDGIYYVAKRN